MKREDKEIEQPPVVEKHEEKGLLELYKAELEKKPTKPYEEFTWIKKLIWLGKELLPSETGDSKLDNHIKQTKQEAERMIRKSPEKRHTNLERVDFGGKSDRNSVISIKSEEIGTETTLAEHYPTMLEDHKAQQYELISTQFLFPIHCKIFHILVETNVIVRRIPNPDTLLKLYTSKHIERMMKNG